MQVESWHPGKLALVWGLSLAVLALFLFARPAECNDVAVALWLVLIAPLGRWTWKWSDAREEVPPSSTPEEADKSTWKGRLLRWGVTLAWVLLLAWLSVTYFDCSSGGPAVQLR